MYLLENMSDCCNPEAKSKDPNVITKIEFLESKALNFKKYIESFNPDSEVKSYIDTFKPELLAQTITTVIVPIVQLGQIEYTIDELMTHLTVPESNKSDVKKKLMSYLQMFNDVLLK